MRQDCYDSWFHGEIYNDPSTILVIHELLVLLTMSKFLATSAFMLCPLGNLFGLIESS